MVRLGLEGLHGEVDGEKVEAIWTEVLGASDYSGAPLWCHADLMCSNLLLADGQLTGVIDWQTCGVGDPAIETYAAWSLLPSVARRTFRKELAIDEATWLRGVGWILPGVFGIVYYRDTNKPLVAEVTRAINEVLSDFRRSVRRKFDAHYEIPVDRLVSDAEARLSCRSASGLAERVVMFASDRLRTQRPIPCLKK